MVVKKFISHEQQYILLKEKRNLKIENKDNAIKELRNKNYFNLINGLETLLVPDYSKGKIYETETFDNFIDLYKFDREFSEKVLSIISEFEITLRSSVSYNFTRVNCATVENTMQYTNKSNYNNIRNGVNTNYPFFYEQNGTIVKKFDDFNLFRSDFLSNLLYRYTFIKEASFTMNNGYIPPVGCHSHGNIAIPLWVTIQTFQLGSLKMMCHYLKPNVINPILNDFGLTSQDRDMFLNSLDIILELRNCCAHFSLLNRFSTSTNTSINISLINKLKLNPINPSRRVIIASRRTVTKPPNTIKLFDCLKILGLYQDLNSLKKPLKKVIYRNNKRFKRSSYDLNSRLLDRMGEKNYGEWKKILIKK